MSRPEIYFYIPPEKFDSDWPKSLSDNWVAFGGGANVWTYFTPIALREHGYPVHVVTEMPDEGIVLSHSQYLPQHRVTNDKTLLICIRADYGRNHPAEIHVVQNAAQENYEGKDFLEYLLLPGPSYYIPYWPQPGLIPRNPVRANCFENIVYMGARQNLAPEIKSDSFREAMERVGVNFIMNLDRASWHDYSAVDAILAVRSFSRSRHLRKPPSKLINAWLAGVPAILGPDSAFRTLRQSEHDYLEVVDVDDAIAAVERLRTNPKLRAMMAEVGLLRGKEYSIPTIAQRWIRFFDDFAIPYYKQWRARTGLPKAIRRVARDLRIRIKNVGA